MVDFLVIGAGSAGAHTAYFLKEAGFSVKVLEQKSIASGASGAAGAFISPRLGKGGPLQRITNEAFRFSTSFYKETFPHLFAQTGILRLPKDEKDAAKFKEQIPYIDVAYELKNPDEIDYLEPYAKEFGGIYFCEGGIADAHGICQALLEGIEVQEGVRVEDLEELEANNIVIATGAWDELLPWYIELGRLAGSRIDAKGVELPVSVHKRISISKAMGGVVAVGATHRRVKSVEPIEDDLSMLIEEAKRMSGCEIEVLRSYFGVRPSVNDHFPYAGVVRDRSGTPIKGRYMIGGFGGRGFVFGAWVAKKLVDFILNDEPLPSEIDSDRYYKRWRKRHG